MVAQHVVAGLAGRGEGSLNGLEIALLDLHRVGRVDQVAEFHEKVGRLLSERIGRFGQLVERLAVVTRPGRRLVGVMEIGEQPHPHAGDLRCGEERLPQCRSRREDERPLLKKRPAAE